MRSITCLVLYVLSTSVIFSQKLNEKQIKDSILSVYGNMNEVHMSVYSRTDVKGQESINFTYHLYKKRNEFYIKYSNMEVIFNTSMVLMVVPDQKVFVIRPVTEYEAKGMREMVLPQMSNAQDTTTYHFSEVEKYYTSVTSNPTEDIAKMIYFYSKTTFLLEKVEYVFSNTKEREDQKTSVNYTYSKLTPGVNYFNTDKYIIKTAKGYVPTAAYPSYSISLNDPYEN